MIIFKHRKIKENGFRNFENEMIRRKSSKEAIPQGFSSTMHKNNSRNSSNSKECSPVQLSCNLIGKCHTVGYLSKLQPLTPSKKSNSAEINRDNQGIICGENSVCGE